MKGTTMRAKSARQRNFRFGPHVFLGTTLAVLLVTGVGGWAATANLNGAVIAPGAVVVDQNLKSIQHRDGGIIADIAVREGDLVQAGQILLRLEDAHSQAELSIVRSQQAKLEARRARLLAERDGLPEIEFPSGSGHDPVFAEAAELGERRLFEGNRAQRESRQHQLRLTIHQTEEEIEGLEAQLQAKADEIRIVQEEHGRFQSLVDSGLMELSRLYGFSRDSARMLGEQGEIEAAIARARMRISEINLQILDIDEASRTEAQRELSEVESSLSELSDRRIVLEDLLARTEIRSPITGTINELNVDTIGGVISPAEVLVTIVPFDARLRLEARIAPAMIDQVDSQQVARIRFPAFNQRTTPELLGRVTHVSPATSRDAGTGEPYYLAVLDVPEAELQRLNGRSLLPGMPVEVYITTDSRSALSYLVKPITDQMKQALTER